jgi:hypothetical protein
MGGRFGAIFHVLVELGLVARFPQAAQKLFEFGLFAL